ncbi:hypothetical protein [Salinilacihabitans rarus]|uniref:hypothetical protein n=1 Tax=Salinilacihabitans rarus TaxID=2961596 RepID=UPI0020C93849|nr:hypothetical protein [Salinilacihabitans rarus]
MDQGGFVRLAVVAIGIVVLSFFVLGFSRLVLPYRTAQTVAAPVGLLGFALLVYLSARATLSAVGIWEIEESEP